MYNFERRVMLAVEGITSSDKIIPKNKRVLLDYTKYLRAKGKSLPRQIKLLLTVKKLAELLGSTRFKAATRKHMVEVISEYEFSVKRRTGKPASEHTKSDFKKITKLFYAWLYDVENPRYDGYPKAVNWIRPKQPKSELKASDLLTRAEVTRMIRATTDIRLMAVCYECGLRIGEALELKMKDVNLEEQFASLAVKGKTGPRQAYSIESLPLLMQWLDAHPAKENPDAWLWTDNTKPLTYDRAHFKLLQIKKKAKVHKRVHFHLFRHSSATRNADLGELMLRKVYGWSKSSDEPSTYIHLSGEAVKKAMLQKYGLKQKVEEPTVALCPRCNTPNQLDASLCGKCKSVLKLEDAVSIDEIREKMDEQNLLVKQLKATVELMQKGIVERDERYFERKYPFLTRKKN